MAIQKILHGDSRDVAKMFHAKKKIKSIITDPPFGVDNLSKQAVTPEGKKQARKIANDESPEVAMSVFREVMEVMMPGMQDESDIYVFTAHQVLEQWLPFTRELFAPHGFERKAIGVWEKDGPGMGDLESWGMGFEFILYFKRGRRVPGEKRRNFIMRYPQISPKKLIHPHEKPEPLLEALIKYSTDRDELVVDPFGGSGSLARAARNTGRHCVAIEYDEYNYERAMHKFETKEKDIFGE